MIENSVLPELVNASSERWFAVDWMSQDRRTLFRLANPVGYQRLHFGTQRSGTDKWSTVRVGTPERFMTRAPETYEQFLVAAQVFVCAFEGT
ncbi:hypothetical protein JNUCC0626_40265 [Lentzea sp. JNUCC 0626]|uniref:hypothetical protein n=1 Tax=Lentzea sp. JNUCC 0626 TaxID=3367513 RepID=UPI00374A4D14